MSELERTRRIRSAARVRGGFAAAAVVVPSLLGALFVRQASRLDALAAHGVATEGRVTDVTRASDITHYAYRVAAVEHTWNVAFRDAPYDVGATLPVLYLPEAPSFSRPTHDRASIAADASRSRSFATKVVAAIAAFFALFAYMGHRELARLSAREPTELDDPALYRSRVRRTLAVLGVLALAIAGAHASDARAHGEPAWPVAIGLALSVAILGGVFGYVARHGPREAHARAARLTRWLVPVAVVVALLRVCALLSRT